MMKITKEVMAALNRGASSGKCPGFCWGDIMFEFIEKTSF
jgi:hypothetical protein